MSKHGYSDLPDYCFWQDSVARPEPELVDPVVRTKFQITKSDKIATAGSCFAQHIARHLGSHGFTYFVTEPGHPIFVDAKTAIDYNYGVFTARYGNIYTARQLAQLLMRAYDLFAPEETSWPGENARVFDPFRPRIQPRGFSCAAELEIDRRLHLAAVRRAVETLNVFVFTLGLTEAWRSRETGAVYPICPGVAGGSFDGSKYEFHNFRVHEVVDDLAWAIDFVRSRNRRAKFILTVSPVPLAATAEDRSVLASTVYSKSVLRVAAEEIAASRDFADYFPSYEIITGAFNRGAYFAQDLRSVTESGVSHVMRLFMKHYAAAEADQQEAAPSERAEEAAARRSRQQVDEMREATRVVCDEEMLANRG